MSRITDYIVNLLGSKPVETMTAEEIIEAISENLYTASNTVLLQNDLFQQLPQVIQDIILVIEFDTELSINGMWGFLHNTAGLRLNDTIDTFQRIEATEDYAILSSIKDILSQYNISPQQLRDCTKTRHLYEVSSLKHVNDVEIDLMAEAISEQAQNLYVYHADRNIFDYLIVHVNLYKESITLFIKQRE